MLRILYRATFVCLKVSATARQASRVQRQIPRIILGTFVTLSMLQASTGASMIEDK